jgi:hypothetical protein
MGEANKNGNIWRFYALRELIPPNIGNKYSFMYSAHGFRSSRTILYHEYFDFQPLGERLKSLSVRYWVEKGDNKNLSGLVPLFVSDGDIKIYELPDVEPILRYKDYSTAGVRGDILRGARLDFRSNSVDFKLNVEVSGDFVFSSAFYPGFFVKTPYETVEVTKKDHIMQFTLTNPTKSLTIQYQPSYYRYMLYFYGVVFLSTVFLLWNFKRLCNKRFG